MRPDQLRDRGDLGLTQHVIAAYVHHVPRSVSSFDPTSLLFPFSDSGFSSLPPPTPVLSLPSFSSLSSTAPSSTVPIFSLPSVVPSVLPPPSLPSSAFSALSSSFSLPLSSLPSPSVSSFSAPRSVVPPLVSSSFSPWFSSLPQPPSSSSAVPPAVSSVSVSSPPGDFASFQALVLGLSDEYQALGHWFFASGGSNFPSYLSAHSPHLYSDFRLDFASGSSRFLTALASSPPPPPSSSTLSSSAPSSALFSSRVLPPSAPSLPHLPVSSLPPATSSSLPFFWRPLAPVAPCASFFPSASPLSSSVASVVSAPPSFPFSLGDCRSWAPGRSLRVPGTSGVAAAPAVPGRSEAPVSTPSLFRPFTLDPSPSSSSVPVSSAPLPPGFSSPPPSFSSSSFSFPDSSAPPPDPSVSFAFGYEDLSEDSPPDAVPHVLDPGASVAFPDSVRSEFHRTMAFIVDLFRKRLVLCRLLLLLLVLFSKTFSPLLLLLLLLFS